jgi:hypothetical protein
MERLDGRARRNKTRVFISPPATDGGRPIPSVIHHLLLKKMDVCNANLLSRNVHIIWVEHFAARFIILFLKENSAMCACELFSCHR